MVASELLVAAESVKNMLVARAIGQGDGDNAEYQRQRELLLADASIKGKLPRFVLTCRTLDEFWGFIQAKFRRYHQRSEFLSNEFEPLLSMLEQSEALPGTAPSTSHEQEVLDMVADALVLKNMRVVRGLDLRQDVPTVEGTNKHELILGLVPEFLRVEGRSGDESYGLMPAGGLRCRYSATIRNLARDLRALLVSKYRQDRDFDKLSWEETKQAVQLDGRDLTDEDFETVNFVLLCLGVQSGSGAIANWEWSRPSGHHLEALLDAKETDQIFVGMQEELGAQVVAGAAPHFQVVSGRGPRRRAPARTTSRSHDDDRKREMETETRSILFMDLAGWSSLKAPQVVAFVQKGLPKLAELVRRHGANHVNTWGDALVATFGSTRTAADCALDVRDFFRRAPEVEGIAGGVVPRIALHVGEVIIAYNPVLERPDIFGEAVHLAARLEPITRRGEVYCTEQFAKALAEITGMGARADRVGEVQLPKNFGTVPVFAVAGPNEPPPASLPEPLRQGDTAVAMADAPGVSVSDESARVRVKGWLNKLGPSRSGAAIPLEEIEQTCGVSPGQPFRLLAGIVEQHRLWEIEELTEDDVILKYNRPFGPIVT